MCTAGDNGIVNDLVMAPIAVRPLLSLKRCEAASHTCSLSASSSIHARGLDMIFVRYCGTPSLLILRLGREALAPGFDGFSHESGWTLRSASVDNSVGADGLV